MSRTAQTVVLAAYFAFGGLLHAIFAGLHFDPTSLVSWAWLVFWPATLFVVVLLVGFAAGLVLVGAIGIHTLFVTLIGEPEKNSGPLRPRI